MTVSKEYRLYCRFPNDKQATV